MSELENLLDVGLEVIEGRVEVGEGRYHELGERVVVEDNSWEAEVCRVLSYEGRAEMSITEEGPAYQWVDDRFEEVYGSLADMFDHVYRVLENDQTVERLEEPVVAARGD